MKLTERQKKYLRGLAHARKPVVTIADKGLSAGVVKELEAAIDHHELIKIKVRAGDRDERDSMIERACAQCGALLIQRIGNTATLYRPHAEKPKITLPAAGH